LTGLPPVARKKKSAKPKWRLPMPLLES